MVSARVARHNAVAGALAGLGDDDLAALVGAAPVTGAGIGGGSSVLDVAGAKVFVKRIPLTDLERQPGNLRSTANHFDLPARCQWGVGSPGFGAWRELAAHEMTTGWVLEGRSAAFPLLHHWRVLPGATPPIDEHADIPATVAFWGGSAAVGRRLRARAAASASVVLFLEHLPSNLDDWLRRQLAAGPDAVVAACTMVHDALATDIAFLNANGLLHFDAHFANVLTDGRRLYITDFGLATSPSFRLSPGEREFLARNAGYDRAYTVTQLVNWIVTHGAGVPTPERGGPAERNDYVRACAAGADPAGLQAPLATIVRRHAPVATIINDFLWQLFGESRATPYPAERLALCD
ncbi:hypothetical protein DFJ67_5946 [Asanoa ferruginea]|uniref:Protein kinase domain-containing protein n=1 Tax=Asanoa ferruginea TaxID=53367 RepID=A0A3D9ZTW3_9ACTN|nr:hypothetical protein DFJ67_5946 [Asanoa ferruginea]GIF51638.1 hypothetical protein Afe04nite_61770 [Asanoa ferruginea]